MANLGELHAQQGRLGPAESALRRAMAIRLNALGPETVGTAVVVSRLASVLTAQERYEEAKGFYLSSLPVQERVLGSTSPEFLIALERYAGLLRKMENNTQAETVEARVRYLRAERAYTVRVDGGWK
jgi:hypothetical protein